jgi:hypothetical protein
MQGRYHLVKYANNNTIVCQHKHHLFIWREWECWYYGSYHPCFIWNVAIIIFINIIIESWMDNSITKLFHWCRWYRNARESVTSISKWQYVLIPKQRHDDDDNNSKNYDVDNTNMYHHNIPHCIHIDLSGNPLGILRHTKQHHTTRKDASSSFTKQSTATATAYMNTGMSFLRRKHITTTIKLPIMTTTTMPIYWKLP